jgi:hypothetical protein
MVQIDNLPDAEIRISLRMQACYRMKSRATIRDVFSTAAELIIVGVGGLDHQRPLTNKLLSLKMR